jgi:hypothetical protein
MSATAQNDRVNNITLEDINAKVVDTVNRSSEIMKRVVARPQAWNGRSFQSPIFTNNSGLGQTFKGAETFSTDIDMNTVSMTWYPTGYAQPVGISTVERSINSTPAGVIDMYQVSYQYAQNSMITNLANIFYGLGSGNNFDGLALIVDDGTNTSSYAGLTRATYPTINAGNTTGLIVAASGVLDLATMASADDAATISGDVSETPNVLITNQTVWSLYDSLLEPTSRANYNELGGSFIDGTTGLKQAAKPSDGLKFSAGATSVSYRGKPMVRDQKSPTGDLWFLNEDWFDFKSLKLNGLNTIATTESVVNGAYDDYSVSAFQFREMLQPVNSLSEVGVFVMYGNIVCLNPNRNELITSITTT